MNKDKLMNKIARKLVQMETASLHALNQELKGNKMAFTYELAARHNILTHEQAVQAYKIVHQHLGKHSYRNKGSTLVGYKWYHKSDKKLKAASNALHKAGIPHQLHVEKIKNHPMLFSHLVIHTPVDSTLYIPADYNHSKLSSNNKHSITGRTNREEIHDHIREMSHEEINKLHKHMKKHFGM